jgi:hypothetical protein
MTRKNDKRFFLSKPPLVFSFSCQYHALVLSYHKITTRLSCTDILRHVAQAPRDKE